jgi:hypothetical protein
MERLQRRRVPFQIFIGVNKLSNNKINMKTIAFWDNCLCERGTTVALFDYAYYNQTFLHNKSIILYNNKLIDRNNNDVIEKFTPLKI